MRSKAPLALMEQLVMVLVFALAAALCLQVFVFSDQMSERNDEIDRAVTAVQTAAETLKVCGRQGGDMGETLTAAAAILGGRVEQGLWYIPLDENWQPTEGEAVYTLNAQGVPTEPGLWKAHVWADTSEGDILFAVDVAWQEVS